MTPDLLYIGYCNSMLTVGGYHAVGGRRFAPQHATYKSGTVRTWAKTTDSERWRATFLADLAEYGTPARVWWELGAHNQPVEVDNLYADALAVLHWLRLHYDGPVDVSGMSDYDASALVLNGGAIATGPTSVIRDRLVAEGRCTLGPTMPTITALVPTPAGEALCRDDGVHPKSPQGVDECGLRLLHFPLYG